MEVISQTNMSSGCSYLSYSYFSYIMLLRSAVTVESAEERMTLEDIVMFLSLPGATVFYLSDAVAFLLCVSQLVREPRHVSLKFVQKYSHNSFPFQRPIKVSGCLVGAG